MIFNAFINVTRAGALIYAGLKVQFDDDIVSADPGLVEIMSEASSSLAPLLRKQVYGIPGLNIARDDLVIVVAGMGQVVTPNANPFHVLRVNYPFVPLPATEVYLARVDMEMQTAQVRPWISDRTPLATPSADFDTTRGYITDFTDLSGGGGYEVLTSTPPAFGYLPTVQVTLAVNEYATASTASLEGRVRYESPVLVVEPPSTLGKGDLVVLADGRRLIVADIQHQVQRNGVTLATLYRAEYRDPISDPDTYQIPL